ncbi:hypothetical protein BIW11_00432, partial [Tropilaelaps mercedesae]
MMSGQRDVGVSICSRQAPSFGLQLLLVLVLSLHTRLSASDEHNHMYTAGEEVVLWVNTVGPYANRQETYSYFSLPFCPGPKNGISHYHETLGENLLGVELQFLGLDIRFKKPQPKLQYCEIEITKESFKAFRYALKSTYWYQMYIDDLPIWGMVGKSEPGDDDYIWTHKKFEIGYNGNKIVDVNLTSEGMEKLELGKKLKFTFEVEWKPSSVNFRDRFDKYLDPTFYQHRAAERTRHQDTMRQDPAVGSHNARRTVLCAMAT